MKTRRTDTWQASQQKGKAKPKDQTPKKAKQNLAVKP